MKQHQFEAKHVTTGYDKKMIINEISLCIPSNKISVIIGANACGKSTLLKTFARLLRPESGEILLDGGKIREIPSKQLARTLGLLPQSPVVPVGITVYDLVARGRYPYQRFGRDWSGEDYKAIKEALELMGIEQIADRLVDELSGGQRQRVWIAMALAQQTDILLLDEPTTFLDITHQIEILDLLTDLNRQKGTTIVMVLHDMNLSARYADYIFALRNGEMISQGIPEEVMTESLIEKVFSLSCVVAKDPVSGTPFIVPKGRYHTQNLM